MSHTLDTRGRNWLQAVGSLWLGAALLVLLLAALACATVYESTRGTEQALVKFYTSPWFAGLLLLMCINILAAVIVRFQLSVRKIGFLLTHVSVLLILIGAVVTKYYGVDGQLALVEGESGDQIRLPQEKIMLQNVSSGAAASAELPVAVFGRLEPVDGAHGVKLAQEGVNVSLARYLPDSIPALNVVNDGERERLAVELILSAAAAEHRTWLFEGETTDIGPVKAALRVFASPAELEKHTSARTAESAGSIGNVRVQVGQEIVAIPVETCRDAAVPVGQTPYTVRVLDYFPHATVGANNAVTNASDEPMNPAIRAELTGPEGSWTTLAFANFPDFRSTHGQKGAADVKVTFIYAAQAGAPTAPVEILAVRNGPMHVRFNDGGPARSPARLEENTPVPIPGDAQSLKLVTVFDHAERRQSMESPEQVRQDRAPAVLVNVRQGEHTAELWLTKHQPRALTVDGAQYQLAYTDQAAPLGFSLRLDDFKVGYYPGGRRPRSFESRVTITDPAIGATQSRLISMNHPTSFAGFTFYQSSYEQLGDRDMSVLSVARDPGQPIVFTGYFGLMAGMLWVLVVRVGDHRRNAAAAAGAQRTGRNGKISIALPLAGPGCVSGPPVQTDRTARPDQRVSAGRKIPQAQEVSS